jgi:hypothetical protein
MTIRDKQDLMGVVARIHSKHDAEAVIDCCKKYGIQLADWEDTKYNEERVAAKIGYHTGDMGGKLIFSNMLLPTQSSASEFINLRELKLSDITSKKVRPLYIEQSHNDAVSLFDKYEGLLYSAPHESQKYVDIQHYINDLEECGCSSLYLRTETVIDDRQEFIDGAKEFFNANEGLHVSEILGKMFDSGRYKVVNEDE